MAKVYTVTFSTKHPSRVNSDGQPDSVKGSLDIERPTTLAEAIPNFFSEEEIVSLAVRDENTNVGNVARATLVAALNDGKTDAEALELALAAAGRYEAGEKTKRTGQGKLQKLLLSIMQQAATNPKALKAMQDIGMAAGDFAKQVAIAEQFAANA